MHTFETSHSRDQTDTLIWRFVRENEFVVISKDSDFRDLSFVAGQPPKAIWLDVGNASTSAIIDLVRHRRELIERFGADPEESLLILSIRDLSL